MMCNRKLPKTVLSQLYILVDVEYVFAAVIGSVSIFSRILNLRCVADNIVDDK